MPAEQGVLLPCLPEAVPPALRKHDRWALWTAVWKPERGKWDKVPVSAADPARRISTKRPEEWGAFDLAVAGFTRWPGTVAGLGYLMTGAHGVVMIDLDRCVSAAGEVDAWALEVWRRVGGYAEVSPSGKGLRLVGLGAVARDWTHHEAGVEVYAGSSARYLTITGAALPGSPGDAEVLSAEGLEWLAEQYGGKREASAQVISIGAPELLDPLVLPDVAALSLPQGARAFLQDGQCSGDRSAALYGCGVALYAAGLDDQMVYSVLAANEHAMAVALDHRRQDEERALHYLWLEHCHKARRKGQSAVAKAEEFDDLTEGQGSPGGRDLPPLKRDKNGRIDACIENLAAVLRRPDVSGVELAYDEFRDELMARRPGDGWVAFRDADYTRVREHLERNGFKPIGRELMRDVVLMVAEETTIDTARMWLDALEWDGVPRVETFCSAYFGAEDTAYTRAVALYMWSALAGRVLSPGVKADMVPILVGGQGERKSSVVAAMAPAPDFFCEISLGERDDDLARRMRGRLLCEISELRGLGTRDLESIKAFITRTHENWVPKYKEFATSYARRCLFIGTTNADELLADETGNRRWLPVRVQGADLEALQRDRLQLWAEARDLFTLVGVLWQEAERLGAGVHSEFAVRDSWTEIIADWIGERDALTGEVPGESKILQTHDVARNALNLAPKEIDSGKQRRISKCLRMLGYVPVQRRVAGEILRVWEKKCGEA